MQQKHCETLKKIFVQWKCTLTKTQDVRLKAVISIFTYSLVKGTQCSIKLLKVWLKAIEELYQIVEASIRFEESPIQANIPIHPRSQDVCVVQGGDKGYRKS